MTTQEAFKRARWERNTTTEQWEEISSQLISAGYCPRCAEEGDRIKLGRMERETRDTYAGRACPQCEEFYRAPGQSPSLVEREDYAAISDADPGL